LLATAVAMLALGCASHPQAERPPQGASLTHDVFVSDEAGFYVTSTLISGEKEAVLVDGQFTLSNGRRLAEWIARHDRRLKAIYVTHAHPDHFFGLQAVLERFPGTPVYTAPEVVPVAREMAPRKVAQWTPMYGAEIPQQPVLPSPLPEDHLMLEGHRLDILHVGQGDLEHSTAVHVPDLGLLVGGDLLYSGVHVWTADVPQASQRRQWLASLERLGGMPLRMVVPGHMTPGQPTTPQVIAETRAYLEAFDRSVASATHPDQVVEALGKAYPAHALPIILSLGAKAAVVTAESSR
jgi:glyoxylase-like metal-dependent hydrolase (beta-lactamase superfamily II)